MTYVRVYIIIVCSLFVFYTPLIVFSKEKYNFRLEKDPFKIENKYFQKEYQFRPPLRHTNIANIFNSGRSAEITRNKVD